MQVKKFAKWGLALTSTLVLGGVVAPVGGQLLNAPSVVYAQEKTATANVVSYHPSGVLGQYQDIIPLGGSKTYTAPVFDGWEVYAAGAYSANFSWTVKGVDSVTLPEGFTEESVLVEFYYKPMQIRPTEQPAEQPADQPVEQPTEQPADQPVEKPAETPTEQPVFHPYVVEFYIDGEYWGAANRGYNSGWPYVRLAPYSEEFPGKEWPKEELDGHTSNLPNVSMVTKEDLDSIGGVVKAYWTRKPVEQPAEKPVDQPAETSTAQPVETPTEQPTEKPATTPTEQPAEKPVQQPVEQPTEQPAEKPVETPTEKTAEQPAETKPVEQPVETSTDQPTEKPTATSLLAGNTTSKAQTVATTDKKKVDNSTPSTNAVKSEEGSQATAKTLPKTGDSSSMLLVLGGFLSGLSGLGLAATSRKKD
ncbi:LPXTG cell wall anchor domain-containing protein [Streptococcus suis]|nr:LPXTG cell wall anchor domain-containing protein [Streptococcus suis]NRG70030.1 LPXTG cell wall anchor domain-containing protein [Streptococcus suis]